MPIDSTANLLFSIGANSDDAEANVQRFRSILSKDLGDLRGEFSDWSTEVFGDLGTVGGAMTAAGAAAAAAVVGIAAAAMEATKHWSEYVEEVDRGSRVTGISVEKMSGLKFAAEETHTSYESLITGLTRFSTAVVKGAEGGEQQATAFARLGITQAQVKAGEKDLLPLLDLVADGFKGMGSQVEKTATARDLFGRQGADLVKMLSLGAIGLHEFEEQAAKLGYTVLDKDVVAMEQMCGITAEAKAELNALSLVIGKDLMPTVSHFLQLLLRMGIEIKDLPHLLKGDFWATFKKDVQDLEEHIRSLAAAEAKLGEGTGAEPPKVIQQLTEQFRGASDLLTDIKEKILEIGSGEEGKIDSQIEHLNSQLAKAQDEFIKLRAAGKLTADDLKSQEASLLALPNALHVLAEALQDDYKNKLVDAVRNGGMELEELVLRQGEQTLDVKNRLLDLDVAKRRAAIDQEKGDTSSLYAWLAAYEQAARQKIAADKISEWDKFDAELSQKERASAERTHESKVADLNREIDLEEERGAKIAESESAFADRIAALRKNGLAKIDADEKAAGDQEIARLDQQQERIEQRDQTHYQRIVAEYETEAEKYSAAEQKKTLSLAINEAQRQATLTQFAAIRKSLLDREQTDLQALQNSTGWQGVFGSKFAELIRGNEAMLKQWSSSTNQSAMLVKVTLEGLKETGEKTFESLAAGMGSNIAHAIVYEKSIGAAMKAALESTLENLAGQSIGYAIYSLALGFTDLAEGNEAGATAAFTAAAIWGAVGAAAGLAGRGLQGGAASSGAGAGGSAGLGTAAAQTSASQKDQQGMAVGPTAAGGGPHIQVNVYGHVVGTSGVGQLIGMINDAVLNNDQTLTATNTKTGVVVNQ